MPQFDAHIHRKSRKPYFGGTVTKMDENEEAAEVCDIDVVVPEAKGRDKARRFE
jgi:hypothetical protein